MWGGHAAVGHSHTFLSNKRVCEVLVEREEQSP